VFNLYINERRIEDVTVLDLKGRIRINGRTRGLHKSVRCLVEEGKTRILLNLSQVTHMDSSGLDELVASCVTAATQGGEIKLLHPTEQMREVITTANLSAPFDTYNNEYDAIASFKREVFRVAKPLPSLYNNDDAVELCLERVRNHSGRSQYREQSELLNNWSQKSLGNIAC
jgi:anti-sigma B factor antagonist